MKFTVSSAELLKALMDVSKAIPAKSVQPILENFLFVLKDNNLEITASDSDLTLRTCIEVEKVQEEGSIAVPAISRTCSRHSRTSRSASRPLTKGPPSSAAGAAVYQPSPSSLQKTIRTSRPWTMTPARWCSPHRPFSTA